MCERMKGDSKVELQPREKQNREVEGARILRVESQQELETDWQRVGQSLTSSKAAKLSLLQWSEQ